MRRQKSCTADANPPDPQNCPFNRGQTFNPNASSTWAPFGSYEYQANYSQSNLLGYYAASEMGTDTVTLGWPGAPSPVTLENQFIGGLLEKSIWYIGNFGIFPRPVNITTLSNQHDSVMQNLRAQNSIPSMTWGYTAGFQAAQLPTFGSLTLGGYDSTRFRPNNGFTVPFGPDQTRDLLIAIQSISSSSSSANTAGGLLPNPIYAFIDSTIPTMWLPLESCRAFERAFNLTWSDEDQYYLLTDEQHQNLLSEDPSVTFTLGANLAGGQTIDITLPYSTFDLQLSSPIATQPTNYFPLQRAQNNTQYVLGRTFLQQAYVIADYDRLNFTVAQALFPQQNVQPNIVPIYPPGVKAADPQAQVQVSSTLGGGAIAGIVVGVIALIGFLGAGLFFVRRSRKRSSGTTAGSRTEGPSSVAGESSDLTSFRPPLSHHPSSQPPEYGTQSPFEKAELHAEESPFRDGGGLLGYNGAAKTQELEGVERHEMGEVAAKHHEMDAGQTLAEMDTEGKNGGKGKRGTRGEVYEMPG
ncbi:MAG: hypothetical protein Q9162_001254 [Coniocarpon cinnabarinum]